MERIIIKENDPTLRKISKPVKDFDARLHALLDDMADTMYKADGAGLSAVQVGVLKRVFVIDVGNGLIEFVNPILIKSSGTNKIKEEGCLSVPGKYGLVDRPETVWVKYQDRYGNEVENKFKGYAAKAFCHEYDHLDGILFIDKATKIKKC